MVTDSTGEYVAGATLDGIFTYNPLTPLPSSTPTNTPTLQPSTSPTCSPSPFPSHMPTYIHGTIINEHAKSALFSISESDLYGLVFALVLSVLASFIAVYAWLIRSAWKNVVHLTLLLLLWLFVHNIVSFYSNLSTAIHFLYNERLYEGMVMLMALLCSVIVTTFFIVVTFEPAGYAAVQRWCGGKGTFQHSSRIRPDIMHTHIHFITCVVLLSLISPPILVTLPWKNTPFSMRFKGFPTIEMFKIIMFQKLFTDGCCVVVVCVAALWSNISRLALVMSITSLCYSFINISVRLGAEKLQGEGEMDEKDRLVDQMGDEKPAVRPHIAVAEPLI